MSYQGTTIVSAHGIKNIIGTIQYRNKHFIRVNNGPNILFLNPTQIPLCLREMKLIREPFVLIVGTSYIGLDKQYFLIRLLLAHPFLIRLYCQNWCSEPHPKVVSLPIGLDYHTLNTKTKFPMFSHKSWGHYTSANNQEQQLLALSKFSKKIKLCYVNFKHSVHLNDDRKEALQKIPNHLLYIEQKFKTRIETWKTMAKYKYVISPHGLGLDCHRTWEAIALGCIPIVKKSSLSVNELYNDLPVLIVDNWSDITKELLEKNHIQPLKSIPQKLKLNYWKKKIYDEFAPFAQLPYNSL